MKKRIAILGFGKVGQVLLDEITNNSSFSNLFEVSALWNRTKAAFEGLPVVGEYVIYEELSDLIETLSEIDLVVECAHPSILWEYGVEILSQADLFISSPTAFADPEFRASIIANLNDSDRHCYIPLGASVGIWDIIKMDQQELLKKVEISMQKDPTAFKTQDHATIEKLNSALTSKTAIEIAEGSVSEINKIAPQNSNTMAVYALAARSLGFEKCKGRLVANNRLTSHIVTCNVETRTGLEYQFKRNNPAKKGAVTGSATFGSFLNSLKKIDEGIKHNYFTFC